MPSLNSGAKGHTETARTERWLTGPFLRRFCTHLSISSPPGLDCPAFSDEEWDHIFPLIHSSHWADCGPLTWGENRKQRTNEGEWLVARGFTGLWVPPQRPWLKPWGFCCALVCWLVSIQVLLVMQDGYSERIVLLSLDSQCCHSELAQCQASVVDVARKKSITC